MLDLGRALGPEERMLDDTPPEQTSVGDYSLGADFMPTTEGQVTHLRYYHFAGHPAATTHLLTLWLADGTKLAEVIDAPPVGDPAHFREVALPDPVPLTAGVHYRISYSSDNLTAGHSTFMPASLAPSLVMSPNSYYAAARGLFPGIDSGPVNRHVDVVFRSGTPDTEPPPDIVPGRRGEIVAALGTVPGLAASSTTPDNIVPGAAWPVWSSSTWVTSCYWRTQWYVFVALTNGQGDATSAEGDPLVDAIGDALAGIGLGGLICEPWVWPVEVGGQTVPVLRFTAVD